VARAASDRTGVPVGADAARAPLAPSLPAGAGLLALCCATNRDSWNANRVNKKLACAADIPPGPSFFAGSFESLSSSAFWAAAGGSLAVRFVDFFAFVAATLVDAEPGAELV
jgi:hypothetical protein